MSKPLHIRPSLYAMYYEGLKEICYRHGYNLMIHGSMNRDFDLCAVAWVEEADKDCTAMVYEMLSAIGGQLNHGSGEYTILGYRWFGINLHRSKPFTDETDKQYYLDLKVIEPCIKSS